MHHAVLLIARLEIVKIDKLIGHPLPSTNGHRCFRQVDNTRQLIGASWAAGLRAPLADSIAWCGQGGGVPGGLAVVAECLRDVVPVWKSVHCHWSTTGKLIVQILTFYRPILRQKWVLHLNYESSPAPHYYASNYEICWDQCERLSRKNRGKFIGCGQCCCLHFVIDVWRELGCHDPQNFRIFLGELIMYTLGLWHFWGESSS